MLKIKNLSLKIDEKQILKDFSLEINPKPGEVFVLFGPNGCGKSSLFRTVMGFANYKITKGDIFFNDKDITKRSINERVDLGLAYMYQSPPKLKGVKMEDIIVEQTEQSDPYEEFKEGIDSLDVGKFYDRDINVGLSGGEVKRSELFTLSILPNTKLFLLDEPDSGVDIDNLKKLGDFINRLLKEKNASAILVTHTGALLPYLNAGNGAVMYNGQIVCEGDPKEILKCIEKDGYESCLTCKSKKS